jgi:hypothetical protein
MVELVLILSSTHGHSSEAFGASLFPSIKANQKVLCFFAIFTTRLSRSFFWVTNHWIRSKKFTTTTAFLIPHQREIPDSTNFFIFFCEQPAAEDIPREGRRGPGLWSSKYVCYILKLRVLGRSSAFLSGWQVDDLGYNVCNQTTLYFDHSTLLRFLFRRAMSCDL